MNEHLAAELAVAYLIAVAACGCAYYVLLRDPSREVCRRLCITWVFILAVAVASAWAFDVAQDCTWEAIAEMFGWCVPCAWYYWYSIGCP